MTEKDKTHSKLSPSGAHRWANCPGSVALSAKAPRVPTSFAAAEGTVAHMVAENILTGITVPPAVGTIVKQDGHDIEVTDEMYEAATVYTDLIDADYKALKGGPRSASVRSGTEMRVRASSIDEELWGTADRVLYQPGNRLIDYDFKYGRGVAVEVIENEQLMTYAVGAMDGEAGWAFDEVELVICQPRAPHADGPIRRWKTTPSELKAFVTKMKKAVAATRVPNAPVITGDWCRWCPAQALCPAMYKQAQETAGLDFDVVAPAPKAEIAATVRLPEVRLMPPEKLAAALAWEDTINSWYEAVRAVARETLSNGGSIPGWKLVDGRSTRRWESEEAVVAAFAESVGGRDNLYERKILSPAKLEKIVGKGVVDGLTVRTDPPKTIARDTDGRPAARSSAQDDFAAVDPLDELMGSVPANGGKRIWP